MTRIYPQFIVAKFGGTSVADFDAMNAIAIIKQVEPRVVVPVHVAHAQPPTRTGWPFLITYT